MLQRFFIRPNSKNSVCNNSDTNEDPIVSLSFEKVIFLFAIFLFGSVFAILLLIAERSFSYFKPPKKKVKLKIGSKTRYIYEKQIYISDHSNVYGLCMFFCVLLYLICVLMCYHSDFNATEKSHTKTRIQKIIKSSTNSNCYHKYAFTTAYFCIMKQKKLKQTNWTQMFNRKSANTPFCLRINFKEGFQ